MPALNYRSLKIKSLFKYNNYCKFIISGIIRAIYILQHSLLNCRRKNINPLL